MPRHRWLEEFEEALVRKRLPPEMVRRLMEELSDHVTDLKEESMDSEVKVEARLGEPSQVAALAGDEFRSRSLLNRSRGAAFATYVLLPIPLLVASWLSSVWSISLAAEWLGTRMGVLDHWRMPTGANETIAEIVLACCLLVPAVGLTWAYCRLSQRTGSRRSWVWAAIVILAVLTGLADYHVRLSEIPGQSTLTMGLGIMAPSLRQWLQMLLPLAVGACLIRRSSRTQLQCA